MELNKKLGLGTVQFGTRYGIGNSFGKTPKEEVSQILNIAKDFKIKIIDTAPAYGNAEQILGANNIDEFKIISKFLPSNTNGTVRMQFNESISALKVEKIYGYLAHRPQSLLNNELDWKGLMELKKHGFVNKIGYSLNTTQELKNLLKKGYFPDIIQIPFNLFDDRFKEDAILLKDKGCEIHSRSSFLQGLFFMNIDNLPPFFNNVKMEVQKLQINYKENLSSALLNYTLNQNFIDYVIIGVENKKQLFENINRSKDIAIKNSALSIPEHILMPSNWPTT